MNKYHAYIISLMISFPCIWADEISKIQYTFTDDPIDVVIPCHPKDAHLLNLCIEGIIKNGAQIRSIYVISEKKITENAIWVPESNFPFTQSSLLNEILNENTNDPSSFYNPPHSRIGWVYQQLLKLYSIFIIPGISNNVLVLDSDTIFLKETSFIAENGAAIFNVGNEYNKDYFEHAAKLLNIKKVFPLYSGICHHMLFQKCVMEDLFKMIRNKHKIEPWKAICRCINTQHFSGISEYEIYFNFCFMRSDQFHIKKLRWANIGQDRFNDALKNDFQYISCHSFRAKSFIEIVN